MFNYQTLNDALRKLDADACASAISADGLYLPEVAKKFVSAVRLSGCLLLKHPDGKREVRRDNLILKCRELLAQCADPTILEGFERHAADARAVERGFREMDESLRQSAIWQLPPDVQAWGIIHRGVREFAHFMDAMQKQIEVYDPDLKGAFDPKQLRLKVEGSVEIEPEHVEQGNVQSVGTTLFLLAYGHGWIDRNTGVVVLPPEVADNDEDAFKAGTHTLLSLKWRHLERTWDRARFFAAHVRIDAHEAEGKDGELHPVDVLNAETPDIVELWDHVAANRLEHMFFQHQMAYHKNGFRAADTPDAGDHLPLPPEKFISLNEVVGSDLLERAFCVPLDDENQLFEGLPLKVWLRGYAYYGTLARNVEDEPILSCPSYAEADLITGLMQGGMSEQQARSFIALTTFQKYALDLFDAPLLRVSDGSFRFFAPAHFSSIPSTILLSRIGSLNRRRDENGEQVDPIQFHDKGRRFEARALSLFEEAGIPARTFQYRLDGVSYDCDVAVLLDDTLFIFECKNYSLPLGRLSALYYFQHELAEFGGQVARICQQLKANPEIVRSHFGADARWHEIVPCVLQALPWSAGRVGDVCFYDQSALSRFLEGEVVIHSLGGKGMSQPSHRIPLWKGTRPTAPELMRELENPIQLQSEMIGWNREAIPAQVGERFFLFIPEWRKRAVSTEEQLGAFGCSEEEVTRIAAELANPPSSLLDTILSRDRKQLGGEMPGRNDPCICSSGKKFKNCCWSKLHS